MTGVVSGIKEPLIYDRNSAPVEQAWGLFYGAGIQVGQAARLASKLGMHGHTEFFEDFRMDALREICRLTSVTVVSYATMAAGTLLDVFAAVAREDGLKLSYDNIEFSRLRVPKEPLPAFNDRGLIL
jgi:hypothetical protein